ncbi:MAG: hypothetical protein EOP00_16095 [Pedobacter sp.]|nr:MAG: hypothetical protein EOP00_16095 [Pedobacter sp.]
MKSNKQFSLLKIAFVSSAMIFSVSSFAQSSGSKSKTSTNNQSTATNQNSKSGETLVCIPMSEWNSMYGGMGNNGGNSGDMGTGPKIFLVQATQDQALLAREHQEAKIQTPVQTIKVQAEREQITIRTAAVQTAPAIQVMAQLVVLEQKEACHLTEVITQAIAVTIRAVTT